MADPVLVDESDVPPGEPLFRVPPHFVVDELVRQATAELKAQVDELATQRELAEKATAELRAQIAELDARAASVAELVRAAVK